MTIGAEFARLLEAAQRGDEGAISALYRDANPRLLRFLSAHVPGGGEDLAADVWLAVAKHLTKFRGDESAWIGFLFTIARRQVASHWRRDRRRRTVPVAPESLAEEPARTETEEEALRPTRTAELVSLVLRHLSGDQADVILLRLVAGLDIEAVAQIMNKSVGNVRVLQHRAVKRLAAALTPEQVTA
ncbi:MAG: RNA polymerase sigma factor [Acidimicrobiales bacterium]